MEADHYENFPVAGVLLPKALRAPVGVIYHVVRTAAEIADEGDWSPPERHARLADFRAGLDAVARGRAAPVHPTLFAKLADAVRRHGLPLEPFYELVSAFEQDVDTMRYADRPSLLDYCSRSANPVGELMLRLIGAATPENLADSDSICTGLQLVSLLRDIPTDWQRGRVYLPLAERRRFGVSEAHIAAGIVDDAWRALMRHEIAHARALIVRGAPLALRVPGRFGLELCSVVHGALRVLDRIEHADYDVFYNRPALHAADWAIILLRTAAMWLSRRVGARLPSIEGNA
ncbi:squalene synthase HpnC [Paraburkholderia caballeronis]|uniref:Squalene synthase HpnC n=1 Tax=Paraburkholderia caballeronis TaxID=416943 RepID=A0A1H7VRY1_9BURK|nr:squalene synthase HpnC [Paraburkholderia caballeronis]PXW15485.1 squalene synthase HpnC [Paraburkholderia caballeronis]PXW93770.1 squalene synthase HpnC [Paraburkholderia caballeronis]RAJ89010.1 squalene synthase HpnC [Paraburkholderia caballeronis]SED99240.1 squalene synthase HpnC [Paraburkholderia caballeronis]SEM12013.1 squalene synthase HpnC [Paraburkholderia caballeronis]